MSDSASVPATGAAGLAGAAAHRTGLAWLGAAAAVLLGLVLLYSAWGKALDPRGIGELYARKGLFPASIATPAIVLVVAIEAGLGLALVANLRRVPVLLLAGVMMTLFFGLTMWEYLFPSKDAAACGCFGNLVARTPAVAAITDGIFVLLALLSWLGRPGGRTRAALWLVPAAGLAAGLALSLAAPTLPIDDLATRLKPGTRVASLTIDEVLPQLRTGRALVLLLDRSVTDEAARARIAAVNQAQNDGLSVVGIAEANETLAGQYMWSVGPAFEIHSVPFTAIKPLYRTLPRSFLVEDGVVTRTWNDLPDGATLAALTRTEAK